jgi:uncharacterized membrane protein
MSILNIILWIIQGVLAVFFLMAGVMKLGTPKDKLEDRQPWAKDYTRTQILGIGALEILGALGLILPGATNTMPGLTVIAAAGLGIMMVAAAWVHLRRGEMRNVAFNILLVVLCGFVAFARYGMG